MLHSCCSQQVHRQVTAAVQVQQRGLAPPPLLLLGKAVGGHMQTPAQEHGQKQGLQAQAQLLLQGGSGRGGMLWGFQLSGNETGSIFCMYGWTQGCLIVVYKGVIQMA